MECRKGRDRKTKLTAVVLADATSVRAAAEATGIPRSTLQYWLDDPDFVPYRHKAREAVAEEVQVVVHLAWQALAEMLRDRKLEPRDVVMAAGMALDKSQLLGGQATARVETKDLSDLFDDHETRAIVRAAQEYVAGAGPDEGSAVAQEPAVEGAGS